MKRDMDTIRQILLTVRESEKAISGIDGIAPAVFFEHVRLLDEAGLVTAALQIVQNRTTAAIVWRLTWAGQDFADAIPATPSGKKPKTMYSSPQAHGRLTCSRNGLKPKSARACRPCGDWASSSSSSCRAAAQMRLASGSRASSIVLRGSQPLASARKDSSSQAVSASVCKAIHRAASRATAWSWSLACISPRSIALT